MEIPDWSALGNIIPDPAEPSGVALPEQWLWRAAIAEALESARRIGANKVPDWWNSSHRSCEKRIARGIAELREWIAGTYRDPRTKRVVYDYEGSLPWICHGLGIDPHPIAAAIESAIAGANTRQKHRRVVSNKMRPRVRIVARAAQAA